MTPNEQPVVANIVFVPMPEDDIAIVVNWFQTLGFTVGRAPHTNAVRVRCSASDFERLCACKLRMVNGYWELAEGSEIALPPTPSPSLKITRVLLLTPSTRC